MQQLRMEQMRMSEHKTIYDGIELSIKPYCHNCEKFNPKVFPLVSHINYDKTIVKRIISCEDINRCSKIENFIKENMKNEEL